MNYSVGTPHKVSGILVKRGRLKHSWLENQILNKSEDDLANIRARGSWDALDKEFLYRTEESKELAKQVRECFLPLNLICSMPAFDGVSESSLEELSSALAQRLPQSPSAYAIADAIEQCAISLRGALCRLKGFWLDGSEAEVKEAWVDVLKSARSLQTALGELSDKVDVA